MMLFVRGAASATAAHYNGVHMTPFGRTVPVDLSKCVTVLNDCDDRILISVTSSFTTWRNPYPYISLPNSREAPSKPLCFSYLSPLFR